MVASAILIALFSTFIYSFIKSSFYEDVQNQLLKQAQYIAKNVPNVHKGQKIDSSYLKNTLDISIEIVEKPPSLHNNIAFKEIHDKNGTFMVLYYPYNFEEQTYLKVTKNIDSLHHFLFKLLRIIILSNILSFALIFVYAYILSKALTTYITRLTAKLASMNEHMLKPIKVKDLPQEFQPLAKSINMLINRIQTFIKYQKELFIGIAHELKTPLAVMKLKNEVTLLKKRSPQEYMETIRLNIKTINEMNKMIESILQIGRQESDQFEPPVELDLISYLKEKSKNYELLAKSEGKNLLVQLKPKSYKTTIQPTLLNHILQNFIQNAIKFTPKGGTITLRSTPLANGIKIEVLDEGPGIDENVDLFAPFKRAGNKSGVGLGLFLAKNAADAMGATISIKNRKDRRGAVATLFIPSKLACPLC